MSDKPEVVTLCGSSEFFKELQWVSYEQTLMGRMVLSVVFPLDLLEESYHAKASLTDEQEKVVRRVTLHKIDISDIVYIINKNGYIDEWTEENLAYAREAGKKIEFLETPENIVLISNRCSFEIMFDKKSNFVVIIPNSNYYAMGFSSIKDLIDSVSTDDSITLEYTWIPEKRILIVKEHVE